MAEPALSKWYSLDSQGDTRVTPPVPAGSPGSSSQATSRQSHLLSGKVSGDRGDTESTVPEYHAAWRTESVMVVDFLDETPSSYVRRGRSEQHSR